MKAELKPDETILITPENMAEAIALKAIFQDVTCEELSKKVIISWGIDDD